MSDSDHGQQTAGAMAAMPCDHGKEQADKSQSDMKCRPGMACFAALGGLPAQPVSFEPVSYEFARLFAKPETPLQSHPPDPTLRPPKQL